MSRELLQQNEISKIEQSDSVIYKTQSVSLLKDPIDIFGENAITKVENEEDCYQIDLDTALDNFANKYGDDKKFAKLLDQDPSLRYLIEADNMRRAKSAGVFTLPEFYGLYAEKDKDTGTYKMQIRMEKIENSVTLSKYRDYLKKLSSAERRQEIEAFLYASSRMAEDYDIMHTNRILHRDTKPENLLFQEIVTSSKNSMVIVRMIDLGLSLNKRDTNHTSFGTPAYSPPEQVNADALDGTADQYSLAMIYAEMLAGSRAISFRNTMDHTSLAAKLVEIQNNKENFIPEMEKMISKNLGISLHKATALGKILRKACSYRKEDRYHFCLDFMTELQEAYIDSDEVFMVEEEDGPTATVEIEDLTKKDNLGTTLIKAFGRFIGRK